MKKSDCTIRVAKTKALISFTVTAKLICVFVFAYAKKRFSHDAAQFILWIFGVEEWNFEVERRQILCSLAGFTKTNTELFLLQHITTLTSIQARIIFFLKIVLVAHYLSYI